MLHVIQNLNYGGMERLLAELIRSVDPERLESHILALQYLGRFAEGLDSVAELHLAEPLPRYSLLWPGPLIQRIAQIAPDVVHTHSGVWYKASLAARMAGVRRVIHTEHGRRSPDPWSDRFIDRLAARRTDVVVAVSDALSRQLARDVVRDSHRIHVVPNGVDTELFKPVPDTGALRRELGLGHGIPILGSIGRLEQIKGYDVAIEAFALLIHRWKASEVPVMVVAGDGAERGRLERLVRARGLEHWVYLLGWRDNIQELHTAFTVFTMSSRSEGTSVSLLEAMSAGLCPVVTDVGGNASVLGDALRHRLVPAEDPDALATAWQSALQDGASRTRDANLARRRVEESFGLQAMARRYERLYLNLAP